MIHNGCVSEEIMALAEQQLEVIKRRFPHQDVSYSYCELQNHPSETYYVRVEFTGNNYNHVLLIVSFLDSSIVIRTPPQFVKDEYTMATTEVINYADPRFTDDTIADMLEELGR